jgi:hypothetical protein
MLLFLLVLGILIIRILSPEANLKAFVWGCGYTVGVGFTLYKGFNYIIAKLDEKIPWLDRPLKRLFVGLGLQLALLLLVVAVVTLSLLKYVMGEFNVSLLYHHTRNSFLIGLGCTIGATLIVNGIQFFIKWREAAVNAEQLKREALALQFNALKNQVNPHFLFNSLSALTAMIRKDQDKAIQFVDQLSSVYRYLLEYRDRELIDLETELAFLDSYIYLYKIRHGDNLAVDFKNLKTRDKSVITFSLQMLVENAIKHNEISGEHPLRIEIEQTGEEYIWVRNNLQPRTSVLMSNQLGLENISERYRILSGREVRIFEGPDTFEVGLPLLPAVNQDEP